MGPSSASNLSTSAFNGYMLTTKGYAQLQRTLKQITGGPMPISRFSFSHSVLNGVPTWKLCLVGKGAISARLYPSAKTAPVTDSSTLRLSYATTWAHGKLTYNQKHYLEMYMTPFMLRHERRWLLRLLQEWMRLDGGLNLDISRVRFSNVRQ